MQAFKVCHALHRLKETKAPRLKAPQRIETVCFCRLTDWCTCRQGDCTSVQATQSAVPASEQCKTPFLAMWPPLVHENSMRL